MPGLKQWLDEHPAAVAIGLAISVASGASATTAYFLTQKSDIEKAETSRDYKKQIDDLNGRLSSIERRAGAPQERKYLDVKTMQIPAAEVRTLPSDFKAIDERLYLSLPATGEWIAAVLTEKEVMQLSPLKSLFDFKNNENVEKLWSGKVFAWHTKPIADVKFDMHQGPNKLQIAGVLVPNVYVQRISRAQMLETQSAGLAVVLQMFGGKSKEGREQASEKLEAVKDVERAISARGDKTDRDNKASETEEKALSYLKGKFEQMFDGDVAGYVFVDALSKMLQTSALSSNITFGINSAQKQFNVMYVDAELSFSDVEISNSLDEFCTNGKGKSVTLRREIFFVSYPQESYLIRAEAPTCGGRSAASDWITQWLSGLRISVKA
ncbi:hypothetical protein BF49_4988 [Bradyrhizobium sp.]|uniref:hypothetical protein n=1 Tax=Bradyrhizobium sp. TaxID=376 RepID=UPI0007C1F0BF|nr:hypothetical protein [Bradyrhizobium sp.]CUT13908.1 hypothetical protein BF49_4988 [Bradyrhizobium sp.]